nr:UvrD-like helicase, ATP-binding domain, P-loop containing nucleoside triphosphate hydrolase [Tanacetum cinerariifolium]
MELIYGASFADLLSINESKSGENVLYDVTVGPWKNQSTERSKDDYHTLVGDLLIFVDGKSETIFDLQRVGRTKAFSAVKHIEDDSMSMKVKASKLVKFQDGTFVVFVMNLTTQKRIWISLHMHRNLNIINEILYSDPKVQECEICPFGCDSMISEKLDPHLLRNLNESQREAVMEALYFMGQSILIHITSIRPNNLLDTPDFTFSIGWLGKFKSRYGIKNFRRFGESGSVEMEGIDDKLKFIRDKVDQFEMKDIFNMDETGLFFRLQPDHSLATMQLEGKKQDKERLTVAICCNEDGSEKLPLWIIRKYAKLRCFKNVNLNSLNYDIDEEDDESSTMEPPSRNEAIKAAITLNNFYNE